MYNMLRMDLRRMFRSRGFKIVLLVTAALILMVSLMIAMVSDPASMDDMSAQGADIDEYDRQMAEEMRSMTQLDLVHETLCNGFLLCVVGIGFTLFVGGDFSGGFIKNTCCAQLRRGTYVLSKVLTAGVYSGILTLWCIVLMLLAPRLFGMRPLANAVPDILQYVFWMWLPHWAFALMGLAIVLLTRSTTLGVMVSSVAGGNLTVLTLGTLNRLLHLPPFERYLLASVVNGVYTPQGGVTQAGMVLACAVGWAVVYGAVSLLAMEKRDI